MLEEKAVTCPVCDALLKDNVEICPYCGTNIPKFIDAEIENKEKEDGSSLPIKKKMRGTVFAVLFFLVILVIIGIFVGKKYFFAQADKTDATELVNNNVLIKIKIQDEKKQAIADTVVYLYRNGEEEPIVSGSTNEDGLVTFSAEPDIYRFNTDKNEYESVQTEINMSNAEPGEVFSTVLIMPKRLPIVTFYAFDAMTKDKIYENVTVYLYNANERKINELNTDQNGFVQLIDVKPGKYTAVFESDYYYQSSISFEVEEDRKVERYLVSNQRMAEDTEVLFYLEWDGDQDLDLCFYDEKLGEYVIAGAYPKDDDGNFIFSDNKNDVRFELFYMRNKNRKKPQILYVVDKNAAKQGIGSTMEADGIRLYVYEYSKQEERIFTPLSEQNSAVWSPFYYQAGKRYDTDQYDFQSTDMSWISRIR